MKKRFKLPLPLKKKCMKLMIKKSFLLYCSLFWYFFYLGHGFIPYLESFPLNISLYLKALNFSLTKDNSLRSKVMSQTVCLNMHLHHYDDNAMEVKNLEKHRLLHNIQIFPKSSRGKIQPKQYLAQSFR